MSDSRSGSSTRRRLERHREPHREQDESESDGVVPVQSLFQDHPGEADEDRQRDRLLDHLELIAAKALGVAEKLPHAIILKSTSDTPIVGTGAFRLLWLAMHGSLFPAGVTCSGSALYEYLKFAHKSLYGTTY